MSRSIFEKDILPAVQWFSLLLLGTIVVDFALHQMGMVWIGRYLGIPGVLLIIVSFLYSLRRRKIITISTPKFTLLLHEYLSWFGSLLVLIHSGIHFNGIIPWAATLFMVVVVASGLVGKYLLKKARETLKDKGEQKRKEGLTDEEIERELFFDSLTVKTMQEWRTIHKPITMVFGILTFFHIFTILIFWRWN